MPVRVKLNNVSLLGFLSRYFEYTLDSDVGSDGVHSWVIYSQAIGKKRPQQWGLKDKEDKIGLYDGRLIVMDDPSLSPSGSVLLTGS